MRILTVTCRRCERTYRCTPLDDYYEASTTTDGLCFNCLLHEKAPDLDGGPYVLAFDDTPLIPEPGPLTPEQSEQRESLLARMERDLLS